MILQQRRQGIKHPAHDFHPAGAASTGIYLGRLGGLGGLGGFLGGPGGGAREWRVALRNGMGPLTKRRWLTMLRAITGFRRRKRQ